jgi:hypothetical protein
MRIFWAVIAVLVLAAGAVMLARRPDAAPRVLDSGPSPGESEPTPSQTPAPQPFPTPTPAAPGGDAVQPKLAEGLDAALRDAAKDAGVPVSLPAAPAPEPAPAATTSPVPVPAPAAAPAAPTAPVGASKSETAELLAEMTGASTDTLPQAPVGVALSRNDDGSLLVDHRFVVRGEGTAERPYEITWEFLSSAADTYKPRLGLKNLPGWLEIINNKHVRITGYIAFPLVAQSPDEMLVMLNQWDGCCIGVPPTPYDAVEVKLANAVKGDDRLKTFGTVEGVLSVDPYLVKDWLIGLYLMKDARLSNTSGVQNSPHLTKPQP